MSNYFEDDNGSKSMGRLLSFCSTWVGLILGSTVSILATWKGGDVGATVGMIVASFVAVGIGGKVAQKFAEKDKTE